MKLHFNTGFIVLLITALLLSAAGCERQGSDQADNKGNAPQSDTDDRVRVTPSSIVDDYSGMINTVAETLNDPRYFHDGQWHEHFGDAYMYGPSFDLATAALNGDVASYQRAVDVLNLDFVMVEKASANLGGLIDAFSDLESVCMALLGLLESGLFVQVPSFFEISQGLAEILDLFAVLFDDYLPPDLGEFAGMTYGPTAISSLLALLNLGLAMSGPEEQADRYMARAHEVLEHIHQKAWSDELGAYRFAPEDGRLMLYPNSTMMVAYGRALMLEDNELYRERIAATYEGIQPLRAESGDHYYSPYSREEANAIDEDYATLSSQNYLMIGLWYAYAATGDQRYLNDIDLIFGWLESHLFIDGVLKHHWVNGRAADSEDLYEFCSGCNLQTLYIFRTIELEACSEPSQCTPH